MRKWSLGLVLLWVCALSVFHGPLAPAGAHPHADATTDVSFHVRVVMVRRAAEPRMGRPSWEQAGGVGVTRLDWPTLRAELRRRGTLETMLDQTGSALVGGQPFRFSQSSSLPVRRFDSRDAKSERFKFDNLRTGTDGLLSMPGGLNYQLSVNWMHWRALDEMVPTASTKWEGSFRALVAGESLVLHSRADVLGRDDHPTAAGPRVCELYCIITARTPGDAVEEAEQSAK